MARMMDCSSEGCAFTMDIDCVFHCLGSQPYTETADFGVPVLLKTWTFILLGVEALVLVIVMRPQILRQHIYPDRLIPILSVQKKE